MFISYQNTFSHSRRCRFQLQWQFSDLTVDNPVLLIIDQDVRSAQATIVDYDDEDEGFYNGATIAIGDDSTSVDFTLPASSQSALGKNQYWLQLFCDVDSNKTLIWEGLLDVNDDEVTPDQSKSFTLESNGEEYVLFKFGTIAEIGAGTNESENSTDFKLGGVDEEGFVLAIVGHVNKRGEWVDTPDKTYNSIRPNTWLANGEGLTSGRNIFLLRTLASDGTVAKGGQSNVTVYRTNGIENLVNAPSDFSGQASIWVTTIGAQCHIKVIEAESGRAAYNYTHNTVSNVWEGWKKEPYIQTSIDAGRVLKAAMDGQGLEAARIGENANKSMWMGEEPIEYPQAIFSFGGRVAGSPPLFDNDFVTLATLVQRVANLQTQAAALANYNYLISLLATKANSTHNHQISDINSLVDELLKLIPKEVLTGGKAYDVLARNASGLPVLLDTRSPYIGIVTLPRAIQGTAYSYTIPESLFIYPSNVYETTVSVNAADDDINFGGWTVTDGNLIFSFTPSTSGYRVIVVTIRWRFDAQDFWRNCQHTLLLYIEPTGAVISAPTAPLGLAATTDGTTLNRINLSWTDASSNEEGFNIYRKLTSGGTYSKIATAAAGTTTFSDSGLAFSTDYTYKVTAFNGSGESSATEDNAVTGAQPSTGITEAEDVDSRRVKKLESTTPVDPTPDPQPGVYFGGRKPNILIGFQSVTYLQSTQIKYRHKTTGQVRTFNEIDQNNNPNRELPDSNWEIIEITDYEAMLERTDRVDCNFLTFLARWPMLQLTETRYNFEPISFILAKAKARGIKISIAIKPDIGNGGLPDRAGFGHDQSATWRYLAEDAMKAQRFAGDNGSVTETFYPSDLAPSLQSSRVLTNMKKLMTALVNYLSNDPSKDAVSSIHIIIGNTGESHMPIDADRYCDASLTTMNEFYNYLTTLPNSIQTLFSSFLSAGANAENNASARGFMRGGGDDNDKKRHRIWQWWLQDNYFVNDYKYLSSEGGFMRQLGTIVKSKGFKFKNDHGSYLDMMAARGNGYALDPSFTQYYDVIKHNPSGTRTGYVETAALKATGKEVMIEWTPGALPDFGGNVGVAVATITTAMKQTIDAGADGAIQSFVVADEGTFVNIGKPIIDNIKASGHFYKPKQVFTPTNLISVNIPTQIDAGGWYNSGGPDAQMVAGVNANGGGSSTSAIQKFGFTIQPSPIPVL